MPKHFEEYIGDGLYAYFDGLHIVLYADRDLQSTEPPIVRQVGGGPPEVIVRHWVALEPSVLYAFLDYVERLKAELGRRSAPCDNDTEGSQG